MHDRELRAAVFTANGEDLVTLLQSRPWPDEAIQLVGDGLLAALAQGVTGGPDLALKCATKLRERDWDGDAELATALIGRLGAGPAPMLRPLPVDLDQSPTCSRGARSPVVVGSIFTPAKYGPSLYSTTGSRLARRTTTVAGCGSLTKAHARVTAIWSDSSPKSRTTKSQPNSPKHWMARAHSVDSKVRWLVGRTFKNDGMPIQPKGVADALVARVANC